MYKAGEKELCLCVSVKSVNRQHLNLILLNELNQTELN